MEIVKALQISPTVSKECNISKNVLKVLKVKCECCNIICYIRLF